MGLSGFRVLRDLGPIGFKVSGVRHSGLVFMVLSLSGVWRRGLVRRLDTYTPDPTFYSYASSLLEVYATKGLPGLAFEGSWVVAGRVFSKISGWS